MYLNLSAQKSLETRIRTMSIIQNIENFTTQTAIFYCTLDLTRGPTVAILSGEVHISKTEHYQALSLSLFLVKYSILNLFLVLVHMQFPNSGFIFY